MQPDSLVLRNPCLAQACQCVKRERVQSTVREDIVRHHHQVPSDLHDRVYLVEDSFLGGEKFLVVANVSNILRIVAIVSVESTLLAFALSEAGAFQLIPVWWRGDAEIYLANAIIH